MHANVGQERFEIFEARHYPGLEMMRAECVRHEFPRHFHSTFVWELVEAGTDEFLAGDRTLRAEAGDFVVLLPGQVHTGKPGMGGPLRYISMYPEPELVREIGAELGLRGDVEFEQHVFTDPALAGKFRAAYRTLSTDCSELAAQLAMWSVTGYLLRRHAGGRLRAEYPDPYVVQTAIDYLHDNLHRAIRLTELAAMCGYSPYHFLRLFRRHVGQPPHEYLTSVRLNRAKHLLGRGVSPVEAASRVGFSDQSHLTRLFRRTFGITPGRYQQIRKIVLDT